jgi:hypothetical protein
MEDGIRPPYEVLVGPNGFRCQLGEPEDRSFGRDIGDCVDELNRLHAAVSRLEAERKELVEALQSAVMNYEHPISTVNAAMFPSVAMVMLDLLVKHGRVTKNGDRYEWRKQ